MENPNLLQRECCSMCLRLSTYLRVILCKSHKLACVVVVFKHVVSIWPPPFVPMSHLPPLLCVLNNMKTTFNVI